MLGVPVPDGNDPGFNLTRWSSLGSGCSPESVWTQTLTCTIGTHVYSARALKHVQRVCVCACVCVYMYSMCMWDIAFLSVGIFPVVA